MRAIALGLLLVLVASAPPEHRPRWTSENRCRILLEVDARGVPRSHAPAAVELDFAAALREAGAAGSFDEATLEVVAYGADGEPLVYDVSRHGDERYLLPHRLDKLYGASRATLSFVLPRAGDLRYAVYFDTVEPGRDRPRRFPGIVGDGDRFRQVYGHREIAASHFDQFVDLDGDGDLDLAKGGVQPWVEVYENVGGSRFVEAGRLASGGRLLMLPAGADDNRSWVAVAFFDWDGDGDPDFFPSFSAGPDAGEILHYENTTREPGGVLTFTRVGALRSESGKHLGGEPGQRVWFPSVSFVRDWDGDGDSRVDLLVTRHNRIYLHRNLGPGVSGGVRLAEGAALTAGGVEIVLENPRVACTDVDGDGDLDLFVGTQPGAVHWFENAGTRQAPSFVPRGVVALGGEYLIDDAHSGVAVADFDGDGLLDLVVGRFWERTEKGGEGKPRDFGGFYKNVGTRADPAFERRGIEAGSPHVEGFPIADAVRQNSVRAVDWDGDGRLDLIAGDTDGFVWLFRNLGSRLFPQLALGQRLAAGDRPLSTWTTGGHARPEVVDLDGDGRKDLVLADGEGAVWLARNVGRRGAPSLAPLVRLRARGREIQIGERASVAACDWDADGRADLLVADERNVQFFRNRGGHEPLLAGGRAVTFGERRFRSVRPNLGSCVDWDGDGKRDLVVADFENAIKLFRNAGPGSPPVFPDRAGETLVKPECAQTISGADVVDLRGDGDLDLLTGQGHAGSGLRFYERDFIEDARRSSHPAVRRGPGELRTAPGP